MNTSELRKELRGMIKQDSNVRDYIKKYEQFTGLKYSGKLTSIQLNDLIMFCINEQLAAERKYRKSIGGII